jgi:hypothetical protein
MGLHHFWCNADEGAFHEAGRIPLLAKAARNGGTPELNFIFVARSSWRDLGGKIFVASRVPPQPTYGHYIRCMAQARVYSTR